MTYNQKKLYELINGILWNDWDPIGVNCFPEALGEYEPYVSQILKLKIDGASPAFLTNFLNRIAVENMGLESKLELCEKVAHKIHSL